MTMISRRKTFQLLAAWSSLSVGSNSICAAEETTVGEITPEQWMSAWMDAGKDVSGALLLRRFKDPMYILGEPISWKASADSQEQLPKIEVPEGFVTDLASIPRVFWSLLRPDGEYAYPAIIHDHLYWTQMTSREDADLIFRLAMKDFKIDSTTALTIYKAVRLGRGFRMARELRPKVARRTSNS